MKVLVADDDPVARRMLEAMLPRWGYEVVLAADGVAAWQILRKLDRPQLAVLDWMMPGMDGLEVVRKLRALPHPNPLYLLMLTAKGGKENVIAGLDAGADDYMTKPFEREELRARLRVGQRILELQSNLSQRVQELAEALARVKQLQGLLPICAYCKRIRDDGNYWQQVDAYIAEHSEIQFSHSICPACYDSVVKPELEQMGLTAPPFTPRQDQPA
jgi:CheY-like chemotaxis protein